MLLGKRSAGSALGYQWKSDGSHVEVPSEIATQLLSIGHAGFYEVFPAPRSEEPPEKVEAPRRKAAPPVESPSSLADALDTVGAKPRGTRSRT